MSENLSHDIETAVEIRKLIDRLEAHGQTFNDPNALSMASKVWHGIKAVALLNDLDYSDLCRFVDEMIFVQSGGVIGCKGCGGKRVVCPNHSGNFDCTPFCALCEGDQEYCPVCE